MWKRSLGLVAAPRWSGAEAVGVAGGGTAETTATSSPSTGDAWVAGVLPDGFVIVGADERAGRRRVASRAVIGGRRHLRLRVRDHRVSPGGGALRGRTSPRRAPRPGSRRHAGHPDRRGPGVTASRSPGTSAVICASSSRARTGRPNKQTRAVADGVRTISDAEWQTLLVEFSLDTHIGRTIRTPHRSTRCTGSVDGDEYVLTALVPGSYPLGEEDRRLDCFHLAFSGETTKDYCPGHPIWARVGGRIFRFRRCRPRPSRRCGSAPSHDSHEFDPLDGRHGRVCRAARPRAFYVATLPEGACSVSVAVAQRARRTRRHGTSPRSRRRLHPLHGPRTRTATDPADDTQLTGDESASRIIDGEVERDPLKGSVRHAAEGPRPPQGAASSFQVDSRVRWDVSVTARSSVHGSHG